MKKTVFIVVVLLMLLFSMLGVYQDREFNQHYLFLKHRPALTFYFYSPLGEVDQSFEKGKEGYLSP